MWLLTLQRLKSKKAKTRLSAINKVATMEDESKALLPLLGALKDPEAEIRQTAARALSNRKEPSVVPSLIQSLADSDAEVRIAAAMSLKKLNAKEAMPSLIRCLRDENEGVRNYSASALSSLSWEPDNDNDRALLAVASGKLEVAARYKSAALQPLLLTLRTGVYYKRLEAVEVLSKIALTDPKVVQPLISALKDEDSSVRMRTVEVLSKIGDARAVEPLIGILRDHDSKVRAASVEALSKMGDARAVTPLTILLKDKNSEVRKATVEALGKLNATNALDALISVLRDSDADVRETAANALGKIGDARAIKNLVLLMIDKAELVRKAADVSLAKIDPLWQVTANAQSAVPQIEAAAKDEDYWVRHSANALLKRLSGETQEPQEAEITTVTDRAFYRRRDAARILAEALHDVDRDLRLAAADALGRIGSNAIFSSLVSSLSDNDGWVRRASARALDSLHWQPANATQHAVHLIALRAWAKTVALGEPAVEPLVDALQDRDPEVRRRAAEALGQIKDVRAEMPLAIRLHDNQKAVRFAAAKALEAIGPTRLDASQRKAMQDELEG